MPPKPILPKVRGVETFMSDTYKIDRLESMAIDSQPQFIDPNLLVASPYQPRTSFPEDEMDDLRQSIISAGGIKVPAIVRPNINELITGGKRQIIAIELGYLLPVYWHSCTDLEAAELAGFENVKRSDLNAIDETNLVINMVRMRLDLASRDAAIQLIQKIKYQQGKDSQNIDVPLDVVNLVEKTIRDFTKGQLSLASFGSHKLKLLNLPTEVVEAIRANQIEPTKAAEIGKIEDEATRNELLDRAVEFGLSVSQVKEEIAKSKPPRAPKAAKAPKNEPPNTQSKGDCSSSEEVLDSLVSKPQPGQSQTDLTMEAGRISIVDQEIDRHIETMTETIRFEISNNTYSSETKQEVAGLLDRAMKLLRSN
jgi:ParB family transcriptional regulator, chromosome partitioning protein